MKRKIVKKVVVIFLILISISFIVINNYSNADSGIKPSITIFLKNMDSSDYYIDLLTLGPQEYYDEKRKKNFYEEYAENSTDGIDFKNEPIYLYNEDGWMATALRDSLLFGSVVGNDEGIHTFSYFGTPDTFKIIIQMSDGTIKVSDMIERIDYNARYTIDVNTMEICNNITVFERILDKIFNVLPYIVTFTLTIVVELVLFYGLLKCEIKDKKKNSKIIILTNLLTNLVLQFIIVLFPDILDIGDRPFTIFIILECIIALIEYYTYKKKLKIKDNKGILKYTLVANLVTAVLTFFPTLYIVYTFITGMYWVLKNIIIFGI